MRRNRHTVVRVAALMVLLTCCDILARGQLGNTSFLPAPGQVVEVVCSADAAQTYALYLPTSYSTAKRWPIVYFFDPGGRGRRPLDLYQDLAEKYSFIFAGSNSSRNFSGDQSEAVNAIWRDTHLRFPLDDRRVYASGFSGGARVAGAMALGIPGQVAGVIAHGAGYPNTRRGTDKLLYYFSIGDKDFNWPEVMTAGRERQHQGLPYRVRQFDGSHQWAPPAVMDGAIRWLQIRAMQTGELPRDVAFIDEQFKRWQQEADDAEKRNDLLAQSDALHWLISDFAGLEDTKPISVKLQSLEQNPALKTALKSEQEQIAEQFSIEREISPKLRAYEAGNVPDMTALRLEIVQAMASLNEQATHAKSEERRRVLRRALDDMKVEGIENGQQEFQAKHFDKAESCFDLMRQISADPWPMLMLAETRVAIGNRKQAVKDLREAVRRGLKDPDVLESDRQLQPIAGDPEFVKLVTELKSK